MIIKLTCVVFDCLGVDRVGVRHDFQGRPEGENSRDINFIMNLTDLSILINNCTIIGRYIGFERSRDRFPGGDGVNGDTPLMRRCMRIMQSIHFEMGDDGGGPRARARRGARLAVNSASFKPAKNR